MTIEFHTLVIVSMDGVPTIPKFRRFMAARVAHIIWTSSLQISWFGMNHLETSRFCLDAWGNQALHVFLCWSLLSLLVYQYSSPPIEKYIILILVGIYHLCGLFERVPAIATAELFLFGRHDAWWSSTTWAIRAAQMNFAPGAEWMENYAEPVINQWLSSDCGYLMAND